MKYVLDSNVALKWVLTEPDSAIAHRLRGEFLAQLHELHAPDVFSVEIAHALARAERQGRLNPPEGSVVLMEILSRPPRMHSYISLLPEAFTLASKTRIGVYDCLYVVLAEQLGCELITADERLARSLPSHPIVLLASVS